MHKRILAVLLLVVLIFLTIGCANSKNTVIVTWVDSEGNLIESQKVKQNYNPTTRELPEDSEQWHYTGWTLSQTGDVVVCTLKRVEKTHVVWLDSQGKTLKEVFLMPEEEVPSFDLPENDGKWTYEKWDQTTEEKKIVFSAKRVPDNNYFVGNVFQIIVRDKNGTAIGSGSGFVINAEGWFVTNYHVMEKAHSATAFFDIKDSSNGEQYTQAKILGGVYYDKTKDIFIGKLQGYEKIKSQYKAITFTENYTVGETTYSVGYPNSTTKLEINEGEVLKEYSDIYNKIDGIYYVMSDSYIAPGSSGGILVNENFEVIGITSMGLYSDSNQQNYVSGGSIPYALFKSKIANLSESNIKTLPL